MTRFNPRRHSDEAKTAADLRRPFMQDRGSQEETESRIRKSMRVLEALAVRIKGGGGVTVEDGGVVTINDGGRIEVYDNNDVLRVVVGKDEDDYDVSLFDENGSNKIALSNTVRGVETDVVTDTFSTTSTSFVDLTGGPAVTVNIGPSGVAVVEFGGLINADYTDFSAGPPDDLSVGQLAYRVSGATTMSAPVAGVVAADVFARSAGLANDLSSGLHVSGARTDKVTGLNEGANTFTLQFRDQGTNGLTFVIDPWITVTPY